MSDVDAPENKAAEGPSALERFMKGYQKGRGRFHETANSPPATTPRGNAIGAGKAGSSLLGVFTGGLGGLVAPGIVLYERYQRNKAILAKREAEQPTDKREAATIAQTAIQKAQDSSAAAVRAEPPRIELSKVETSEAVATPVATPSIQSTPIAPAVVAEAPMVKAAAPEVEKPLDTRFGSDTWKHAREQVHKQHEGATPAIDAAFKTARDREKPKEISHERQVAQDVTPSAPAPAISPG